MNILSIHDFNIGITKIYFNVPTQKDWEHFITTKLDLSLQNIEWMVADNIEIIQYGK